MINWKISILKIIGKQVSYIQPWKSPIDNLSIKENKSTRQNVTGG